MPNVDISVIIPTYQRPDMLRRTLAALSHQTLPAASFEVIVVDDGASNHTAEVAQAAWGLPVRYVPQAKGGATQARNAGARQAQGRYLVFMDDDIEMLSGTLAELVAVAAQDTGAVIIGMLLENSGDQHASAPHDAVHAIDFTHCQTGLLCIAATDFVRLGMFHDPTGGWPNWDDVDFGYRAHRAGHPILRAQRALAIHHDAAAPDWATRKRRWYEACRSAARLFDLYPELVAHLPMFADKVSIDWASDDARLVARKMARSVASTSVSLWSLERLVERIEKASPSSALLVPLQRWVLGGYMFRGYRAGLRELHDES